MTNPVHIGLTLYTRPIIVQKPILKDWTLEKLITGYVEVLNSSFGIQGQIPDISVAPKIEAAYNKYLPGIAFTTPSIKEGFIYNLFRIVKRELPIPPLNITDCSYPPKEYSKINRCNFHGEQIFYGAEHPATSYAESKLRKGEWFAWARWELSLNDLHVVAIHADSSESKNTSNKLFLDFLEGHRPKLTDEQFVIFKHWFNITSMLLLSNNKFVSAYMATKLFNTFKRKTILLYPAIEFYKMSNNVAVPLDIPRKLTHQFRAKVTRQS